MTSANLPTKILLGKKIVKKERKRIMKTEKMGTYKRIKKVEIQ